MTTGVIYARVSSIGDRQSTERQVKDLSEYAKFKGIKVSKVFEEHISGAKKNDERPVLCEAMEYCKANRIGILLVSELSRLGRNAFEVPGTMAGTCNIHFQLQQEDEIQHWYLRRYCCYIHHLLYVDKGSERQFIHDCRQQTVDTG